MAGRTRRVLWVVLAIGALLLACWLFIGSRSRFGPVQRDGPPALVDTGQGPQLWLATRQVEEFEYRIGGTGRGAIGRWVRATRHHLRLQAHDPATARRLWRRELEVVREDAGDERVANAGPVRLLGQEQGVVWMWVHDQLLALSAADASVLADRARLEQVNPALAGLLPDDLDHYAWFDGLIVNLADGRQVRVTLPDFRAESWAVPESQRLAFDHAASMSHTYWGGTYRTEDFGVRHTLADGRWVGLLSEREAHDAEDDSHGDHYAGSEWIDDEGARARRGLWLATAVGRTREFGHGTHARIERLERLPGTGEYLQGRLLKGWPAPGAPQWQWRGASTRPTPVEPLRLADPDGVLLLFRTRLDDQGQLGLARLGPDYRERWRALLPFDELQHRWQVDGRLLLMGSRASGPARREEVLLALDTASGTPSGWEIGADAPLPEAMP